MSNDNLNQIIESKLDMKEAAKFLNCSISFIRSSTKNGSLAHYKIGKRFFYLESDLLTLIKRVEPHNANNNELE